MLCPSAWQATGTAAPAGSTRTAGDDIDGPLRTFRPPELTRTLAVTAA